MVSYSISLNWSSPSEKVINAVPQGHWTAINKCGVGEIHIGKETVVQGGVDGGGIDMSGVKIGAVGTLLILNLYPLMLEVKLSSEGLYLADQFGKIERSLDIHWVINRHCDLRAGGVESNRVEAETKAG